MIEWEIEIKANKTTKMLERWGEVGKVLENK